MDAARRARQQLVFEAEFVDKALLVEKTKVLFESDKGVRGTGLLTRTRHTSRQSRVLPLSRWAAVGAATLCSANGYKTCLWAVCPD